MDKGTLAVIKLENVHTALRLFDFGLALGQFNISKASVFLFSFFLLHKRIRHFQWPWGSDVFCYPIKSVFCAWCSLCLDANITLVHKSWTRGGMEVWATLVCFVWLFVCLFQFAIAYTIQVSSLQDSTAKRHSSPVQQDTCGNHSVSPCSVPLLLSASCSLPPAQCPPARCFPAVADLGEGGWGRCNPPSAAK